MLKHLVLSVLTELIKAFSWATKMYKSKNNVSLCLKVSRYSKVNSFKADANEWPWSGSLVFATLCHIWYIFTFYFSPCRISFTNHKSNKKCHADISRPRLTLRAKHSQTAVVWQPQRDSTALACTQQDLSSLGSMSDVSRPHLAWNKTYAKGHEWGILHV